VTTSTLLVLLRCHKQPMLGLPPLPTHPAKSVISHAAADSALSQSIGLTVHRLL